MSIHAIERASQRYNMNLSRMDIKNIVFLIHSGRSMPLEKVGKYKSFHIVEYKNIPLKVLYSRKSKDIITIYPFDVDNANEFLAAKEQERFRKVIDAISLLEHKGYTVLIK